MGWNEGGSFVEEGDFIVGRRAEGHGHRFGIGVGLACLKDDTKTLMASRYSQSDKHTN